jgi:hypothetical protein
LRDCKKLTKVTLSENTVKLGEGAFQGCKSLKDISFIPASVRIIGDRVFEGCESLESVTIPDTIKSIGAYTFLNCLSLAEVKFPAGITAIPDRMFQGCTELNNTIGDKNFVLPETVKSIGEFAFMNAKFRTFEFNNSVETIAQGAFAACPRLRDVKIPDSVKSIGNNAFADGKLLDKVTLPMNDSLELGKTLFEGSKKLVEITVKAGTKAEKYCNDWKAQIEVLNADIEKDSDKYRPLTIVTQ